MLLHTQSFDTSFPRKRESIVLFFLSYPGSCPESEYDSPFVIPTERSDEES